MKNTTNTSANIEQGARQQATPSLAEADLRDYFAAKAMQALIRELANTEQADEEMQKLGLVEGDFDRLVAKCSYDYADAMLKEREK